MARLAGLEPTTCRRGDRFVRQSHRESFADRGSYGALGGTRTHDLYLRRVALYPLSYKRTIGAEGGI
jgi:hypothetical protein